MARLRKLGKSGNYFALFYDPNRRPKEKSYPLKTTRKEVAMKRFARALDDYEHGRLDPWNPTTAQELLTLQEAVDRFLDSRSSLRPKTLKAYASALRTLTRACPPGVMLVDVTSARLLPLIQDMRIKPATRRYTCASWLVMQGVLLSVVQAILGHSSTQVTEKYSHLAPDVLVAAMQSTFGNP